MNKNSTDALTPIITQALQLARAHANDRSTPMPIIGIAGGPGSGKTYFAHKCKDLLQADGVSVKIIEQDNFLNYNETGFDVIADINPRLKWQQIHEALQQVKMANKEIKLPFRDKSVRPFTTYYTTVNFADTDLVLFEGKYALSGPETFNFFSYCDFGIFIDANTEIMKKRKIEREMARPADIRKQAELFEEKLNWGMRMYEQYILPTKKNATFVIDNDDINHVELLQESI